MDKKFTIFNPIETPIKFDLEERFQSSSLIDIIRLTKKTIKILVVVDEGPRGGVSFNETGNFGVGRVIKLLRDTTVGCTEFTVDIALRPLPSGPTPGSFSENPNPGSDDARYINFRFDQEIDGEPILNNYHELFMFPFAPDNSAASDNNISDHPWYTTDSELVALHAWMNSGGGVFATGDHDYLGASMCHRMPRVGTMRKWTNADGVPPIDGLTRIDTLQPANAAEAGGAGSLSNNVHQYDSVPQDIEWTPHKVRYVGGLRRIKEPHPVLCHPTHGPIDVMPDHAHEGCCFNPNTEIDYSAEIQTGGADEYPTLDGFQPKPKIIATGNVVSRPNYEKGAINAREFLMISVYDGRENNTSNTGRVVVDSTWHHWLNLNLVGLESASDKTDWEKVSRYFINVARWLAPKNISSSICWWDIIRTHFEHPGLVEITPKTPVLEIGNHIHGHLSRILGPCEVSEFVFRHICEIAPEVCRLLDERQRIPFDPLDPVCLSCPPFDILEMTVLGAAFKATQPFAEEIAESMSGRKGKVMALSEKEIIDMAQKGIRESLNDLSKRMTEGQKIMQKAFKVR
ncbi:MAG: hypothetical protein ACRBBR_15740 [Cellvibrionaceae bacterium]